MSGAHAAGPTPRQLTLWERVEVDRPQLPGPRVCCKATHVCASKASGTHAHTCTHTAVHTHTSMSTHAQYVDACTLEHTHTCANTLTYWLRYTPAHTCAHMHTHTHPCAHSHVCNHTRRMSLVMHTCLHTSTHVHIHSHMHTDTCRDMPTHGRYPLTLAHSHEQYTQTHTPTCTRSHTCTLT